MSFVSKPFSALHRKRLAIALMALPLSALIAACGNDDPKSPDTGNASSAPNAADQGNTAVLSANPSSASPSPAAVTIQSPALPASSADPALSAAASTPLATPVIHTVD
ncbi:hypothetical protein LMG28727_00651 [Paraburkholderia kirstenboschensis]|uniref:hypothetical protein n=1 Tax=Paraburkholderia kirstenboschensis TaxID=1245436 RepID=UPI000B2BC5C9|nr:hypothetical protein [Paraburkholderia kirstenboschensis]CAD6513137.1 hypothetical protein LMG28727_00651 [Paraburkholderia kirstenboschensis]